LEYIRLVQLLFIDGGSVSDETKRMYRV